MNQINYNSRYIIHFKHNGVLKFLEAPKRAVFIDFKYNEFKEQYTYYYVFKYGELSHLSRLKTNSIADEKFMDKLLKRDYFVYFSSDLLPVEVIELGGDKDGTD